jgi:hypothetical protein
LSMWFNSSSGVSTTRLLSFECQLCLTFSSSAEALASEPNSATARLPALSAVPIPSMTSSSRLSPGASAMSAWREPHALSP